MTVLVVRGSASDLVDHAQVLDRFFRIVVAGDLPDAERCAGPLNKHAVDVVDVETWLRGTRPKMLIVDALHPALFTTTLPGHGRHIARRTDRDLAGRAGFGRAGARFFSAP
ncbi:MAG: hypothetical protein WDM89_10055 [Rhizomicrobium sp.]